MYGFEYEDFDHEIYKYRSLSFHRHVFSDANKPVIPAKPKLVSPQSYFHIGRYHLQLMKGYAWNGSNVVKDTISDMRGSAIHDAYAQAMATGIIEASWRNWNRAAREYRICCREDGMSRTRSMLRYVGILFGGGNGYKWKRGKGLLSEVF